MAGCVPGAVDDASRGGDPAPVDQQFEADEQRVAGKGGDGGVGRVAVADGIERQHLPEALFGGGEEVGEGVGGGAEVADAALGGREEMWSRRPEERSRAIQRMLQSREARCKKAPARSERFRNAALCLLWMIFSET